jgi:protocatechuate 3,4-dioxygenase beta subunit
MKRVASRLALVALLASILGFGWWLANRDGPGPQVHDVEVPEAGQDAPKPPDLASLASHTGARASRLPRLPRGDGAIVGTVRRDGAPVAARIAVHVAHVGSGYNPWGRGPSSMGERAFALPPSPDAASGSVSSGEDGRFTIADVGAGAFLLVAGTADGATGAAFALVRVEGAHVEVSIPVTGGSESLRGRVVWADGRPFAGTVRVAPQLGAAGGGSNPLSPEGRVAVADADGRFVATGLPAGPVAVTAHLEGRLVVTGVAVMVPHAGEYLLTLDAGLVQVVGRVVREGDDAPVPGASVTAAGFSPGQQVVVSRATSDADGRFELPVPPGRAASLYAYATGFAPISVPSPSAAPTEPLVIRMSRGATVSGRVTRDSDGAPVPGMTVSASFIGPRNVSSTPDPATTDADGRYTLTGVLPGEAMVVASGEGYVTKGLDQVSREGYNPLVVTLVDAETTAVDVVVTAGARIDGTVLDADGAPVRGAVVQVRASIPEGAASGRPLPVASGADGRFTLEGALPGRACTLEAEAPGFVTARAGPFTPLAGTTTTVEVRFDATRFIDVTVLDDAAGTPVAGARITPTQGGGSPGGVATFGTASDGRARVGPLSGVQPVGVEAVGYVGVSQMVTGSETLVVRLKAGRPLEGRVTFADGAPAPGVSVRAQGTFGSGASQSTDANGMFRLQSVPSGPVVLDARTRKDGVRLEATVTVEVGARDVVLRLAARHGQEPGRPRFVARVLDPQGRPVPRANAMLRTDIGTSGQPVNDGRVEWARSTPAGSGEVVEVWGARDASGAFLPLGPATVSVPDGATEVEIRLAPEVTVTGTVRSTDGAPVRGVLVRVQPAPKEGGHHSRSHGDAPQVRTDDAGAFRLGGLAAEEYDLRVVAPPIYAPLSPLRVRGGDRDVDVRLRAGRTVTVTVRDVDGKPVSGVGVSVRPKQTQDAPWSGGLVDGDGGGATTAVDGVARLSGLDADVVHTLQVSGKGDHLGSVTIDPWTPRDETVTLPRVWAVTGVVRDQAGRPVADARVMRRLPDNSWKGVGRTDEQGRFRMTGLPEGDAVLRAMIPGLGLHRDPNETKGDVRVPAGTNDVVVTVDLGLDLVVRVENLADLGQRAPGATLRVRREGQTLTLSPQGAPTDGYLWRGLETNDECTVWIVGSQGPQGTYSVYATGLKPGADVRLRATPGRSILVRLKVPAGASNVQVSAELDGLAVGGEVRPDGSYEIRGIPDGTSWKVTGHARVSEDSPYLWGRATASPGATVELELKPE